MQPNTHDAGWTEERTETLKRLWKDGKSALQIAMQLGGGVTRNGVISKVHREKLEGRASPTSPTGRMKARSPGIDVNRNRGQPKAAAAIRHRAEVALVAPRLMPVPKGLPDVTDRITLLMASDMGGCMFCNGDPLTADHSFCGQPRREGSPWCDRHYRIVFPARASLL